MIELIAPVIEAARRWKANRCAETERALIYEVGDLEEQL